MKKSIPMPVAIGVAILILGIAGFFIYRASSPAVADMPAGQYHYTGHWAQVMNNHQMPGPGSPPIAPSSWK